jgi:hypothetical protein
MNSCRFIDNPAPDALRVPNAPMFRNHVNLVLGAVDRKLDHVDLPFVEVVASEALHPPGCKTSARPRRVACDTRVGAGHLLH